MYPIVIRSTLVTAALVFFGIVVGSLSYQEDNGFLKFDRENVYGGVRVRF